MFNLPPSYKLTLRKGQWSDIRYPAIASIELKLIPKDFFEEVGPEVARSCIANDAADLNFLFDANTGVVALMGSYAMGKLRFGIDVGGGKTKIEFDGQLVSITNTLVDESRIDQFISSCVNTIPVCLSLATDLAVFHAEATLTIGNTLEASLQTCLPSTGYRIFDPNGRIKETCEIVPLIGRCLRSARFLLAAGYFREALYFNSPYTGVNPYARSLDAILACAKAIEILFGSRNDSIRSRCKDLGIHSSVVEADIIPVNLARSKLGPAHASWFVPTADEAETLRRFAERSVHTVRQLLFHISKQKLDDHPYLLEPASRCRDKARFIETLKATVNSPLNYAEGCPPQSRFRMSNALTRDAEDLREG